MTPSSPWRRAEQVGERLLRLDVDPGRRLVEREQLRACDERLGDERALLLAAGEAPDRAPGKGREANPFDRLVDRFPVDGAQAAEAVERRAAGGHDLADGGGRLHGELRALGEVAELRAVGETVRRLAKEERPPARRALEAERDPEQRRLASAVRPRDREELAGRNLEVDVSQHGRPAVVGEVDLVELDR